MSEGVPEITGAVSSLIVTTNVLVAWLPSWSVAVNVTVTGESMALNVLPLTGDATNELTVQLSVAVASTQLTT